jgi:membrane-associated phospholipid phosphatase
MASNSHQPIDTQEKRPVSGQKPVSPPPVQLPDVQPVISEAQRVAAQSSVSGRRAVSRGTLFLAFYLWLLAGVAILSFFAQRTEFFPGDMSITAGLQNQRNRWIRRFFFVISEIGFPKWTVPITISVSAIFWALRFRLESLFILLTSSATLLNVLVKRVVKRPRPTKELVTVVRVINEPSFPSGHIMYYTNFYGLLIYLLTTNWRSGKLRNILIGICTLLITTIGPSRIYLGAHWPSDVLAGYLYGGLWFAGLMSFYLRVKAWIHPQKGKAPEIVGPLRQPSEEKDE